MRRLPILPVILLAFCFFWSACDGEVRVVYQDGYFYVSGIPSNVATVTIILEVPPGTYRQRTIVRVSGGRSEPICIGRMFRTTYPAGQIRIIARDASAEELADVKNKADIVLDGTLSEQNIPFDGFE